MTEKNPDTYTVLHLRFKLRIPPNVFLAGSREAAAIIASIKGLIWKIWISQQEESESPNCGMWKRLSRLSPVILITPNFQRTLLTPVFGCARLQTCHAHANQTAALPAQGSIHKHQSVVPSSTVILAPLPYTVHNV
jgi:hypothetical protein